MCSLCDDTGWKAVERDGIRRVERCECWRAETAARMLAKAGIPPRYKKCTLDRFITYGNEKMDKSVDRARAFIDAFPVVDKGLMIIGPPGIGKTHIAVSVLIDVIGKTGANGLFWDTRQLLSLIRNTYNPITKTAEIDLLRPVMQAELLVLDDLGAERPTDWVEETMNLIVNTRYNERKPTIFTSNYEDIPDREDPNTLLARIGFRIHSRLKEMCEFLEFDGPDYRELPSNVTAEYLFKLWKGQPRRKLPVKASSPARAQIRQQGKLDLGWTGGKAGT